jgi:hypothetical protein
MRTCSGIKRDGGRCNAQPMRSSSFCLNHDPARKEENRRRSSKGGKRGGRGRPSAELVRLQKRFEELAEDVLKGEIDKHTGAVAGQLLNYARACIRDTLLAREQDEFAERLEALEAAQTQRTEGQFGA